MIELPNTWTACERGNTMLSSGDGDMVAWLSLPQGCRLEISFCPDNYPALNVRVTDLGDDQLADHINTNLKGWIVERCNISNVHVVGNCVKG